jgi:hypothetical protein
MRPKEKVRAKFAAPIFNIPAASFLSLQTTGGIIKREMMGKRIPA